MKRALVEAEHNARFLRALTGFVRVFASAEHPLVLFIDDALGRCPVCGKMAREHVLSRAGSMLSFGPCTNAEGASRGDEPSSITRVA